MWHHQSAVLIRVAYEWPETIVCSACSTPATYKATYWVQRTEFGVWGLRTGEQVKDDNSCKNGGKFEYFGHYQSIRIRRFKAVWKENLQIYTITSDEQTVSCTRLTKREQNFPSNQRERHRIWNHAFFWRTYFTAESFNTRRHESLSV